MYTLRINLVGSILAALLLVAFAPLAFAEENTETDWETKAHDKIELVEDLVLDAEALIEDLEEDSDERTDAEEDLADAEADLAAAKTHQDDEEFEDAYDEAVDAYGTLTDLIEDLTEEDDDEDNESKEDGDDDSNNRPAACEKEVRGNAHGLRAKCEGTHPAEYLKEKRAAKCEEAALDEERDRTDYFCRNGEWREKREARLNDIMSGFIEAGDLDDEQAEAIRDEVEELVRKLIALIMANRLR